MQRCVAFVLLVVFAAQFQYGFCKRHRTGKHTTKKSTIPKAPLMQSSAVSHNLPWKEISKKSLIANGVDTTETDPKQKRGFLANLANLLNDAEVISGHKNSDNLERTTTSAKFSQQPSVDDAVSSVHSIVAESPEKKDITDLPILKETSKDVPLDFAPIFAMYHGKMVELGRLPESAFKKSHSSSHENSIPEHHMKDITPSKRVLDESTEHKPTESVSTKREFHAAPSSRSDQLKNYLKNLDGDQQASSVAKDVISMPGLDTNGKADLINHVKSVVLDDGKVISVGNSHLSDPGESPKVQNEVSADAQQKYIVNKEGNVEPLIKQRTETAEAVPRDTLGNGQKTVTLTVDVLKDLLKKTGDSKVSLAKLLNKPTDSSDQRSNTQEDEDPGTIEDFAAGGLKSHNELRGKHHDDNLAWSDDLAAKAQKLAEALADKKTLEIAKDLEKEGMGENVAKVWATFKNAGEAATKMWYSQSDNYHFDDPHLDENTGQFAQVVWKATKELGMGVAKSIDDVNNKYVYVTALYRPPGNIEAVLRNNVLPTGNNTQDVYSTFFKRTGVLDHQPVERRSKLPRNKKVKKISNNMGDTD